MTADSHDRSDSAARVGAASAASKAPSLGVVLLRIVVLGVVGFGAAALARVAISQIGEVFQLPPDLARLGIGGIPGAEDQKRIAAGNLVLYYQHSALWLGTAGAILGGLFGGTLGLFRRSRFSVLCGLAAGALLGGLSGSVAGPLAVYIDRTQHANLPPGQLAMSDQMLMLMHGVTWLVAGLGCGFGAGLGSSVRRGRTAAASMLVAGIAGLLGGAAYPFVAGAVLPLADASLPIPEGQWNRLLWLGLAGVLMGLALGWKSGDAG